MPDLEDCITNCLDCHSVCLSMVNHCLSKGGKHANPEHVRLLQDCAQICMTSADFMLRGSPMHSSTCGLCAEICRRCADDCAKMADDETMVLCAETCRRCAASCAEMASHRAAA